MIVANQQPTCLHKKANLQKGRCKTRQLYQYLHRFFQEWVSSLSHRRQECLKKRVTLGWRAEKAALGARAAGMLPPIPFLHFSWSFTQEAGGQQGTVGSWEGEWEQHHKLHVLPGVLNPVWHVPLLTNLRRARPVFHTAALCRGCQCPAQALLCWYCTGSNGRKFSFPLSGWVLIQFTGFSLTLQDDFMIRNSNSHRNSANEVNQHSATGTNTRLFNLEAVLVHCWVLRKQVSKFS